MNASERAPYLEAVDEVLVPAGFKRRKKEFEWRRVIDRDTEWVHLNFGLAVINPSYGVRYDDVDALFPSELGVRCGPWCLLQGVTNTSYSTSKTPPSVVARDLLKAVEEFPELRDRQAFIARLKVDEPSAKFVSLFSHRSRMLPPLLASLGQREDALTWLARFEAEAPDRDQMVPGYDAFAAYFREKFPPKNA